MQGKIIAIKGQDIIVKFIRMTKYELMQTVAHIDRTLEYAMLTKTTEGQEFWLLYEVPPDHLDDDSITILEYRFPIEIPLRNLYPNVTRLDNKSGVDPGSLLHIFMVQERRLGCH